MEKGMVVKYFLKMSKKRAGEKGKGKLRKAIKRP